MKKLVKTDLKKVQDLYSDLKIAWATAPKCKTVRKVYLDKNQNTITEYQDTKEGWTLDVDPGPCVEGYVRYYFDNDEKLEYFKGETEE